MFKCCRTKDVGKYICTVCLSVFHPSCLERDTKKSAVKLGGYRIFCSIECQTKHIEQEEREKGLLEVIDKLQTDLKEKDIHISRINRRTRDFEDEVADAEKGYLDVLEGNKRTISELEKRVGELKSRSELLHNENRANLLKIQELERNVTDLNIINRDMLTTIETLETENNVYATELTTLRESLQTLSGGNLEPDFTGEREQNSVDTHSSALEHAQSVPQNLFMLNQQREGNKVVVYGDQSARGLSMALTRLLDAGKYRVEGTIFSGCDTHTLGANVFNVAGGLTSSDYFIFVKNLTMGRMDRATLDKVVNVGKFANVIFCITGKLTSRIAKLNHKDLVNCYSRCMRNLSFRVIYSYGKESRAYGTGTGHMAGRIGEYMQCRFMENSVVLKTVILEKGNASNELPPRNQFFQDKTG